MARKSGTSLSRYELGRETALWRHASCDYDWPHRRKLELHTRNFKALEKNELMVSNMLYVNKFLTS